MAQTAQDASEEEKTKESPWLASPLLSSDPKLGTNVGAVVGYMPRFDSGSTQSLVSGFGNYSNTDSWTAGLFANLYFSEDTHKVTAAYIQGKVKNEYEDFLGTGQVAKTEDSLDVLFLRYLYNITGDWYIGAQGMSTNYAISAGGALGDVLSQIGLVGFDSNGLGLVGEYDNRDNTRNPSRGSHLVFHNVAYRESLGGDVSFDAYKANLSHLFPFGKKHLLGVQFLGRWTSDAPIGGYSSLNLRGYTKGNYLAENYSHVDFDARFHIKGRWGASLFAGVGCLYETLSDCDNSDNIYPAVGGGIIYVLKPKAGIVVRAEYAVGESDNSAFYIRLGHPF